MPQKLFKSMFCVAAVLLMFITCTQDTGTSPYDCSKTKAVILLKSSNKSVISDVAIKDTVGDSIYCGFYSNLIMNIDSVVIRKASASDTAGVIIFTLKNIQSLKNSDTVWNSLLLSDTGTITITGTAFLNCNKQLSATATVTILSRPTNNQPKLIVTSQVSMHPGETCTLMVAASDIDTFQVLTFSTVKAPATSSFNLQSRIFMWQAPTDFVGTDSVVFKVQDNGYPPLSDQKTVYLNVQASSVNNKPVLAVKGVRNINPGDSCILKLKATDPDSLQTVTISMLSGPKGSVLKDSIFTWVAPETFTGKDSAIFIAKDNGLPPKSDTVMVYISVSSNIPLPSRPDSLKIVSRTSGLVTLQWHYSSAADFYTLFRASSSHTTTFKAIDTVYDTLCKDSVGTLNCKYYIKAYNNSGESPSSDTVVSLYSNQPPKWQYDTINEVFAIGQTLTLTLSNMCSDPNGYPITYSLVSGKPTGDTIKAGVYSFTPAASDTGVSWPRIVAKNSAGLTDTVTLHLTVTAVDRQAPYLKLFSPATDSTIVETNKQTVKVICKDPSGVASVKCSMGTDTFSVSNTDSIYSATVTGLKSTGMNEILFIATDASVNVNKDTLKVHIKYVPQSVDTLSVIYNGNGSTSGSVPIDTNHYKTATKVTVLGNTGALVLTGYTFVGWNTKNDGSGTSYTPTDTFSMGSSNVTLFAKWSPILNTSKALTAFGFITPSATGTIDETAKTIAVTVPYGTNVTALVATFATSGASVKIGSTVQTSGVTANNFTNPVTYTVTAADGSTQDYVVTVSVALNAAKALTSFSFSTPSATGTISESAKTVAVTVPYGTIVTSLVATFATSGASVKIGSTVQTSGVTANNFTNPVTYTVTAADGSTQDYVVTVSVALNEAKALTSFSFSTPSATGTINESAKTVAITLPCGNTTVTALVATFTTTGSSVKVGSTVQTSGSTPNNFTNSVTYIVTAADGSTASYVVTVTVNQPPTITGPTSQSVCPGYNASLSVSATGATITGYQWYSGSTSGSGTAISSATSASYSAPAGSYWCKVNYGSVCSANSSVATVTTSAVPTIKTNPASQTICSGGSANMDIVATDATSYQWYQGTPGSGTAISGAQSSLYLAYNAGSYYCMIYGSSGCSVTSSAAVLSISPKPTVTIDPTSVNLCPGWNTTLMLTVSGGSGFQYQWYKGNTGTGTAISGETADNYNTAIAGQYYCQVTNSAGCGVYSPVATVTTSTLAITTQPVSAIVCDQIYSGFSVYLSGGTGTLHYQWYNGSTPIATATGYTVFIQGGSGADGTYTCKITDDAGCSVTTNPVTFTTVTITPMNPITNSSWVNQQGVGGNPNGHFWVQIDPPSGTTAYVKIDNSYNNIHQTLTFTSKDYPEVSDGDITLAAGTATVEYWCVNGNGCESPHLTWSNPAWGSHH